MTSIDSPRPASPTPEGRGTGSGRMDGPASDALLRAGRFFRRGEASDDLRTVTHSGGRESDVFYRDRWSHDKVVRSTHGVNCTGSCSWKVYVKEGIITWESQQTDYPDIGDDMPGYEPRGCPRGAAFSWYTYSPTRVRYPYIRGRLMELWRAARAEHSDPVDAWASIVEDHEKTAYYKRARGHGGLVRCRWEDAMEIAAAAHVYTAKTSGPDRVAGFSPIPAMSMASFGAGSRFIELFGGSMLSFYDWYADLPVASPQVFGDQTDVPESADWFNSSYLIMWGSNVPVTRTPDAHFMTEARYRGQKVVVVSPDYADNTKFADEWLHPHPGTDGALAMAMVHVVLTEFYARRSTPEFESYAKKYTDLPFLVTLRTRGDGSVVPHKFVTADMLADGVLEADPGENAANKTVLMDAVTGRPVVPNGTLGDRFGEQGAGNWNLDLGDIDPALSLLDTLEGTAEVVLPRFDTVRGDAGTITRGVPYRTVRGDDGEDLRVTTVLDLMMAQFGVGREGLPGSWPSGYDDLEPYTPAWQEQHTGVPAAQAERIGREFARNALESGGRSMILMGAGTNHWFHSDVIYRAFLALTILTGTQGVNGGGWAHYVGQEKVRPLTGFQQVGMGLDWSRPPRQMIATAFFYLHTGQWKYDSYGADVLTAATGENRFAGMSTPDLVAMSARLGWMPSYPTFDANPLDLGAEAADAGVPAADHVVGRIKDGSLRFAAEDPDGPGNAPKVLTVWRSNLLGSSAKGDEYFLQHLLGTDSSLRADQAPEGHRGRDMVWREDAEDGKLDLLTTLDFRMTSTTLFSDLVFPAATWYEKHDLSSTDMHPFVHSFNAAINPPWETKTDFETFRLLAEKVSELSHGHLDIRTDVVATPLGHDTPDALANPGGTVSDWKDGSCEPVPGKNFPKITAVERDYRLLGEKFGSLGPLAEKVGMPVKGLMLKPDKEIGVLLKANGETRKGVGKGRPRLDTDIRMCEAILTLSGTTNGRLATQGFEQLEARTGRELADLSRGEEGKRITFADTQSRPQPVITSPEWSGSEHGGRRYSAFVINVERLKPWHTLTGRMQFFMDHDWMAEMGEQLPVYRPPLNMHQLYGEPVLGSDDGSGGAALTVRYLTPHNKWSIHSEYQDNLLMLSLSRGGPTIWISKEDAELIGVVDNDWIEAVNRNGVVVARAIVSHRMPAGTVYMHHAQDRVVDVPIAEASGKRGGIHNSATRILIKPSHLIGGYAHFSYAFNYIGPTGNQRDEVTVIRRRSQEVQY
ncbi:nitrate reductase subunit alpha [Dietzia kunjamensis]|uniref:nitrate reductase subunit alpha n=1 Tax=Dietzia kunjamensis TaxID=322509 RepID=UPI002DB9C1EE|nr:nitrate reductase subunit alpha [Dietzia kunjamensis]MEB8325310.1 nitrate reductase subunit alpha [Dietzia kunjamensis]